MDMACFRRECIDNNNKLINVLYLNIVLTEEDRGPGPVERQLRGVEGEGGGSCPAEAAAVSVDEVAGVPHPGVQAAPHRPKHPVRRPPVRPLQVLVPTLEQCLEVLSFLNLFVSLASMSLNFYAITI